MSRDSQNESPRSQLVRELGSSTEEDIALFHHWQETQPIRYRPEYHLWEVFRYKDVKRVLSDSTTFVKESRPDPAQYRKRRGFMSSAFTLRRIEALTPRLIQIVDELLEPARAAGKMHVTTQLASPLPVRVISELLGLPRSDQERIQQWSHQHAIGVPDKNESFLYFSDLLDERKRDPRDDFMSGLLAAEESDDLISRLVAAQKNETQLTREEMISICYELLMTGYFPVMMLLNWALYRLCRHPEIYQALRTDPSLIPGAIEEMLRYDVAGSPLQRMALHDTVLGGHQIKAGEIVIAWTGAANCDETYFPQSERFDIRRSPNPHLTFGYGIHFCPGHALARLEVRTVLERIVTHFTELRLDTEHPVQFMDQTWSRLIQSLDVLFISSRI